MDGAGFSLGGGPALVVGLGSRRRDAKAEHFKRS